MPYEMKVLLKGGPMEVHEDVVAHSVDFSMGVGLIHKDGTRTNYPTHAITKVITGKIPEAPISPPED